MTATIFVQVLVVSGVVPPQLSDWIIIIVQHLIVMKYFIRS